MEDQETFISLVQNAAHWEFEIFLLIIFDGLIGLILWPVFRKKVLHHQSDDLKIEILEKKVKELEKLMDEIYPIPE